MFKFEMLKYVHNWRPEGTLRYFRHGNHGAYIQTYIYIYQKTRRNQVQPYRCIFAWWAEAGPDITNTVCLLNSHKPTIGTWILSAECFPISLTGRIEEYSRAQHMYSTSLQGSDARLVKGAARVAINTFRIAHEADTRILTRRGLARPCSPRLTQAPWTYLIPTAYPKYATQNPE